MKNKTPTMAWTAPRAAVLEVLREQPDPVGINAVATVLGRHPNTVREQLNWLVTAGHVARVKQPSEGRGRPSWLYRAQGSRPREDDYVELAAALAWSVQESTPHTRRQALEAGRHWGEKLVADRDQSQVRSSLNARRSTVELLNDLGYEPVADDRLDLVVLHRCPLLQAAHSFPEVVCAVHLGLVQASLSANGADPSRAKLTPFAAPGECRLRLMAPPAVTGAAE